MVLAPAGRLNVQPFANTKHDFDVQTLNSKPRPFLHQELQARFDRCQNPDLLTVLEAGHALHQMPNTTQTHRVQALHFTKYFLGGEDSYMNLFEAEFRNMYADVAHFYPMNPPEEIIRGFYVWMARKAGLSKRSLGNVFSNIRMQWINIAIQVAGRSPAEAAAICPFRDDVTKRTKQATGKLVRDVGDTLGKKSDYAMRPRTAYLIFLMASNFANNLGVLAYLQLFRCAIAILVMYSFGPRSVELHDIILVSRLDADTPKVPDLGEDRHFGFLCLSDPNTVYYKRWGTEKGATQATMASDWRSENRWIVRNLPVSLWSRRLRNLLIQYQKAREAFAVVKGVPAPELFFTLPGEDMHVKNTNSKVGSWLCDILMYLKKHHPKHFEPIEMTTVLDRACHWVRKGTCSGLYEAGEAQDSIWTTVNHFVAWKGKSLVPQMFYLKVFNWMHRSLEIKFADFFFAEHFPHRKRRIVDGFPDAADLNMDPEDDDGGDDDDDDDDDDDIDDDDDDGGDGSGDDDDDEDDNEDDDDEDPDSDPDDDDDDDPDPEFVPPPLDDSPLVGDPVRILDWQQLQPRDQGTNAVRVNDWVCVRCGTPNFNKNQDLLGQYAVPTEVCLLHRWCGGERARDGKRIDFHGRCMDAGARAGCPPFWKIAGGCYPRNLGKIRRVQRPQHPIAGRPPVDVGLPEALGPAGTIMGGGLPNDVEGEYNASLEMAHRAWIRTELRSREYNGDPGPMNGDWLCMSVIGPDPRRWDPDADPEDPTHRCGHRNWRRMKMCMFCTFIGEPPRRRDRLDPRGDTYVGARTFRIP